MMLVIDNADTALTAHAIGRNPHDTSHHFFEPINTSFCGMASLFFRQWNLSV
jgi:hypothetical protein